MGQSDAHEVQVISADQFRENAVAQYSDIAVAERLQEVAKDLAAVELPDPEHVDGKIMKAIKDQWRIAKNFRIDIEKKRKELKDIGLKYNKAIDGKAKELQAIINPQEDRIKLFIDEVERAEQRRIEALTRERIQNLNFVGVNVNADMVWYGDKSYTHEQLGRMTEDAYEECINEFKKAIEAEQKRQKELEQLYKMRGKAREDQLTKCFSVDSDGEMVTVGKKTFGVMHLGKMEDEEFDKLYAAVKEWSEKKEQEEKEAKQKAEEEAKAKEDQKPAEEPEHSNQDTQEEVKQTPASEQAVNEVAAQPNDTEESDWREPFLLAFAGVEPGTRTYTFTYEQLYDLIGATEDHVREMVEAEA